jgi:uncharacterized protein YbaA (DUF1428 family)
MAYVDGFLLPVPTKNISTYRNIARKAGKIWREHGALQYVEAVADDLEASFGASFSKTIKAKPGETVVFSWIVFKSRKHRDSVNKKVMSDPRLNEMMAGSPMPFDMKRMAYGGFKFLVEA